MCARTMINERVILLGASRCNTSQPWHQAAQAQALQSLPYCLHFIMPTHNQSPDGNFSTGILGAHFQAPTQPSIMWQAHTGATNALTWMQQGGLGIFLGFCLRPAAAAASEPAECEAWVANAEKHDE